MSQSLRSAVSEVLLAEPLSHWLTDPAFLHKLQTYVPAKGLPQSKSCGVHCSSFLKFLLAQPALGNWLCLHGFHLSKLAWVLFKIVILSLYSVHTSPCCSSTSSEDSARQIDAHQFPPHLVSSPSGGHQRSHHCLQPGVWREWQQCSSTHHLALWNG